MNLPRTARAIIALWIVGGLAALAVAALAPSGSHGLTRSQWIIAVAIAALIAGNWVRPVVVYMGNRIDTFQMDEGFFVILALLVPPIATLTAFGVAAIVSQVARRRQFVKSAFNVGETVVAAGLGLAVSRSIAAPSSSIRVSEAAAALLGAAVYMLVNKTSIASVMVSLGANWTPAGLEVEVPLAVGGAVVGIVVALAMQAHPWAVVAVIPALVVELGLVTSRFRAQHDRARMKGLYDVALETTSNSLQSQQVIDSLLLSAKRLLRCSEAAVVTEPPGPEAMASTIEGNGGSRWLVVSGRGREEPFDEADRMLLDAIAAIGKGALTNAQLYSQVRFEQKRLSSITLNIGEGVCAVDASGRVTFVNPAAAEMIDVPSLSVQIDDGMGQDTLMAPSFLLGPAREAMKTEGVVREDDARFIGRDGRAMPVEYSASAVRDQGKVVGAVIAFRDTTERKAMQEELVRHAYYDSLTGLANRGLLMERLAAALGRSSLDHKTHAMIFVDIDRFKAVNDNLGHTTGNDLLREVADRLKAAVGQRDLVARFGGDEFVVLVEDVAGIEEAVSAARRICSVVEKPILLPGGFEHVASVSVGIALTEPGQSADDILRNADVAMFEAKTKGRGGAYKVFDLAAMGPRSRKRLELEGALRKGLDRGEIEVHYQPFFSVDDEEIVGAEALVRWRHPTEGLIRPDLFIPMAEETGLILPLGRMVLEQACQQARLVRDRVGVELAMSVNLSPRQFQHSGLLSEVASALDAAALPSEAITFEITEMMVMEDVAGATDIMKKLSRLGVRIAVDDFLVEHSTFSYLKRFPVDEVKIDRAFVQGVATDPVDTAIVQAIVRLADAMCIEAVAEGVETPEQLAGLKMLGCPIAQGYLLSKPLPSAEFLDLVTTRMAPRLDSLAEQPPKPPLRLHVG